MKPAEALIASFYHYITKSDVQDQRNPEAYIHKLNYLILYNPTPTAQDWIDSMVAFASQDAEAFDAILMVLREHYNSLVPENKQLPEQVFVNSGKREQIS